MRIIKLRDPQTQLSRAQITQSVALEQQAARYPNPTLSWSREALPGSSPLQERHDVFSISVPIEVSGRRAAQRALSRSQAAEARATLAVTQSASAAYALTCFYEALAARDRAELARQTAARLTEAARVLTRRLAEGSASGYAHARMVLEAELAGSALRSAQNEERSLRAEVAGLLGMDAEQVQLQGSLQVALDHDASEPQTKSRALTELSRAQAQAQDAQDAAGRAWIPDLQASGGVRYFGAQGRNVTGYVAGLSVELPVFSQGQDVQAQAQARTQVLRAEAHARERTLQLSAAQARRALQHLQAELRTFEAATYTRVQELQQAAESAYREGHSSLLELLDAQRTRSEVELRRLSLTLAAKRAEIELRAATGELE